MRVPELGRPREFHCHHMAAQHLLAKRRLAGGFGEIASMVRGGREKALLVCATVKVLTNATSFADMESLIQHQASGRTHGTNTVGEA